MPAKASVQQAAANAQDNSNDVRYPVVDVGAVVEAGLNEFNGAAVYACADEDSWEPEAARISERECQRCEGYEVHQLIAALRRWGRRLQGPEHRDGQSERHNNGEGDVEVLAHPPGCIGRAEQRQARASIAVFSA